jgi:uncharacterized protein GlcG (DUF336 family)
MRTKLSLTLTDAIAIAAAAHAYAESHQLLKMPLYPIEGGIPVIIDGQCGGAIGVSGVPPELDAAIAEAGLKALDRTLPAAPTADAGSGAA